MDRLSLRTRSRSEFLDITDQVRETLHSSGLRDGAVIVYSPHTTAGITIQENADPDVIHDMLLWLDKSIPQNLPGFRHAERNSDSHLKTSLIGTSVTVLVENGDLVLGTWQGIYFCEFDGPRTRNVLIQQFGSLQSQSSDL